MLPDKHLEDIAKLPLESPYPVLRVSHDGRLLYSNEAGRCLLHKWDCSIGQQIDNEVAKTIAEAFRENTLKKDLEIDCFEKAYSFTLVPVKAGMYVNLYGVEITDRRKAERELEKIQKQVIQQERLKAIGQMASGIVHDINNALVPILGFSEILIINPAYLSDKEKVLGFLKEINKSAKHAASILSRLKEFCRPMPQKIILNPVDLNRLIKDTIGLTRPKWKDEMEAKGVVIKVETGLKDPPRAAAEESELRELIVNLLFNSIDAMPQGGTITLSTRRLDDTSVFEISDTGIGMPEQVRLRCFEPFFSTKGENGTGLGLAMVYGIVKRYKGSIEVESEEGKGTKFIVTLPAWKEQGTVNPEVKENAPGRSMRILVVDDNPLVGEVLKEYLSCDKHQVEMAGSGLEALDLLEKYVFDVVITDRAMPRLSGTDLAALIKQKQKGVPVILLTGFGDFMVSNGEKPEGVDLILGKPVSSDKLRAAINEVLRKK